METDWIWIIRKSNSTRAWCAECGREVEVMGLKGKAALPGVSPPLVSEREHQQYEQNLKEKDNEKR